LTLDVLVQHHGQLNYTALSEMFHGLSMPARHNFRRGTNFALQLVLEGDPTNFSVTYPLLGTQNLDLPSISVGLGL